MSSSNETFNARHLTSIQVAQAFIPPPQFDQLLDNNHCLLVGARGSGKTTLLKMLQVQALKIWRELNSENQRRVDFIGVFVPADIRWAKQLAIKLGGITSSSERSLICEAAFSGSVCISFLDALEQAIALGEIKFPGADGFFISRVEEAEIVRALARIWGVQTDIPSFRALKQELRLCQSFLPRIALSLTSGVSIERLMGENLFLGISWLDALGGAVEIVNDIFGCPAQKWALLVDELEIVPEELLRLITAPLRSTFGNLLFKYSISPTGTKTELLSKLDTSDPTPGNDFKVVRLWHTDRDQIRVFSSRLLRASLVARGLVDDSQSIEEALDWSKNAEQDEVAEGKLSLEQKRQQFSELCVKDESFKEFLDKKGINISELSTSDDSKNGPLVRKISPLVYFRNYVLKSWSPNSVVRRSKISTQPYSGFPNLLDLTEGNPRWILNLADTLAAEVSQSKAKTTSVRQQGVQNSSIESFAKRFMSMLKVYPVGTAASKNITIFKFIEQLASHLDNKIYVNSFTADPSLSFVVDKQATEMYGEIIETCIHLGALVIIDPSSSDDSSLLLGGKALEDRKVRICYRLAPLFFLPLRSNKQVRLSSALHFKSEPVVPIVKIEKIATKPKARSDQKPILNEQISLF
ncbi:ORC-CDC6 family AAA ATPase [Pseudomonas paralactis]|uniref:ORC-CDC6 family AAA ATPase n=1 Tax=Pseudomonas paralactis TaxID=1615673 RepID=UPI0034D43DFC